MNSYGVLGYVAVARKAEVGKSIAWLALAALMVFAIVGGVLLDRYVSVICFIPLGVAIAGVRSSRKGTALRQCAMRIQSDGNQLSIFMPESRLYDGEYLDQQYAFFKGDIEALGFSGDLFSVCAHVAQSIVYKDRRIIDQYPLQPAEIGFRLDGEARAGLASFLRNQGFDVWGA